MMGAFRDPRCGAMDLMQPVNTAGQRARPHGAARTRTDSRTPIRLIVSAEDDDAGRELCTALARWEGEGGKTGAPQPGR
jgi:hypothetical protein